MLCKSVRNNAFWVMMVIVGIVTLIFSVTIYKNILDAPHNVHMLMGMFTGLGGAFTVVGFVKLIRHKRTSAEKLKEEEIELNDERNIQILRIAYSVSSKVATILFILMAFTFVWLNYIIPALISIGAMYIQLLTFLISHRYFNGNM